MKIEIMGISLRDKSKRKEIRKTTKILVMIVQVAKLIYSKKFKMMRSIRRDRYDILQISYKRWIENSAEKRPGQKFREASVQEWKNTGW